MKKRYIISFHKDVSQEDACKCLEDCGCDHDEPQDMQSTLLANKQSETKHGVYKSINTHVIDLTEEQAEELRQQRDMVLYVEPDVKMKWTADYPNWPPQFMDHPDYMLNIYSIQAPEVWRDHGLSGQGVEVAIVDTGIRHDHPYIGNVHRGVSFVNGKDSWWDFNMHGTHIAAIVKQVAYNCKLTAVRVLDHNGSGWLSWILAGIDWCIDNGIKIANMSLGAPTNPGTGTLCWNAYRLIGIEAMNAGLLIVAAAGNSGAGALTGNPAICDGFMAVGALNHLTGQIADFSSRGPQPTNNENFGLEVMAPGVDIISATNYPNEYPLSGTSMAAPHVTGLAALVKEHSPHLSGQQIREIIRENAIDIEDEGRDYQSGFGYINSVLTINAL